MAPDPLNDPLRSLMPDLDEKWERYDRRKLWILVGMMAVALLGPFLLFLVLSL